MTIRRLCLLASALLVLTACVIEPVGGGDRGDRGDHYRGDRGYGRPVWRD